MWFCIQFNIFIGDNISYIQKTTLLNSIWYRYILKALHNSNTLLLISIKKYAVLDVPDTAYAHSLCRSKRSLFVSPWWCLQIQERPPESHRSNNVIKTDHLAIFYHIQEWLIIEIFKSFIWFTYQTIAWNKFGLALL